MDCGSARGRGLQDDWPVGCLMVSVRDCVVVAGTVIALLQAGQGVATGSPPSPELIALSALMVSRARRSGPARR